MIILAIIFCISISALVISIIAFTRKSKHETFNNLPNQLAEPPRKTLTQVCEALMNLKKMGDQSCVQGGGQKVSRCIQFFGAQGVSSLQPVDLEWASTNHWQTKKWVDNTPSTKYQWSLYRGGGGKTRWFISLASPKNNCFGALMSCPVLQTDKSDTPPTGSRAWNWQNWRFGVGLWDPTSLEVISLSPPAPASGKGSIIQLKWVPSAPAPVPTPGPTPGPAPGPTHCTYTTWTKYTN